jgi:hypothetical protein
VRAGCEDNLTVALLLEDCVKPRQHRVTADFFWGGGEREKKRGRDGNLCEYGVLLLLLLLCESRHVCAIKYVWGGGGEEGGRANTRIRTSESPTHTH